MLENGSVVDDNLSTGSYNDDWSELILQLSTILDLETVEARIYLNLLRLGPVTASSLAKELDVDRTKTYRTIDKLLNMSIVSTTISNPKLCIATKPEEVLKIVLQKKQDEINRVEKIGQEVIKKINKIVPLTDRLKPTETRLGKLPSKGRIIVEEGKQMVMSDVMNASDFVNTEKSRSNTDSFSLGADSDFALWTNSAEMVNNIFSLCKFLWRTSKPLTKLGIKNN